MRISTSRMRFEIASYLNQHDLEINEINIARAYRIQWYPRSRMSSIFRYSISERYKKERHCVICGYSSGVMRYGWQKLIIHGREKQHIEYEIGEIENAQNDFDDINDVNRRDPEK